MLFNRDKVPTARRRALRYAAAAHPVSPRTMWRCPTPPVSVKPGTAWGLLCTKLERRAHLARVRTLARWRSKRGAACRRSAALPDGREPRYRLVELACLLS